MWKLPGLRPFPAEDTPRNSWWGFAARFSKSWPYFRPKMSFSTPYWESLRSLLKTSQWRGTGSGRGTGDGRLWPPCPLPHVPMYFERWISDFGRQDIPSWLTGFPKCRCAFQLYKWSYFNPISESYYNIEIILNDRSQKLTGTPNGCFL